ncbi:MAG: macrolide family glycosyltransferase [Planctomycetaceae bacterium]|nr:macrolide family glycosyltransferase [Planctomycetaceae bacterium]
MGKMALFNIPAWGHLSPTLPVVKRLIAQGETVHYYVGEEYHARVASASGADMRVVPRLVDQPMDKLPRSLVALGALLLEQSVAWLPEALETVRQENYDLILFDRVCPWGRFIAEILKLPAVALNSTVFGMVGGETPTPSPKFLLTELLDWRMYFRFRKAQQELKRRYRLTKLGFLEILTNTAARNLVFTCREFLPPGKRLDELYQFVGPSLVEPTGQSDLPPDTHDRPLVYVSLGTVVDDAPGFYRACIDAFRGADVSVYMSVGKKTNIAELGAIPDNFVIRDFMPQVELLKRADLFISHGGLGSVNESLNYGVPLLMWTQNPEHAYNSSCVVRLGAGVVLRNADLKPAALRQKTLAALRNDRLRQSAVSMRDVFRKAGGSQRAAEEILAYQRETARVAT